MSSSEPVSGRKRRPRRKFTPAEKSAAVEACRASGLTIKAWGEQNGINPSVLHRWLKGKKRSKAVVPAPNHERDIAQLATLNSHPVLPLGGADDTDERLARVLGATIAEVIRRLRG